MRTYTTEILGEKYTYRSATRGELEESLSLGENTDVEIYLSNKCLISPSITDWNNVLAGIPTELSKVIISNSGMDEEGSKKFQQEVEKWANSQQGKIETLMMGVLHYTPEQISSFDTIDWYKAASASQTISVAFYNLDINKYLGINQKKKPEANIPFAQIPQNR